MFRFVAPAGVQVVPSTVISAGQGIWRDSSETKELIRRFLEVRYCFATCSARSAITVALKALSSLRPGRTTVILPAYTCYTVPAAVLRAGLKVRLLDVRPNSIGIDLEGLNELLDPTVLAVFTSNLFGIPELTPAISLLAHSAGAFVVDDAAQALGANGPEGYAAGTQADVGIFSFGRGKSLPAVAGGVIVTNDESIANHVRMTVQSFPEISSRSNIVDFLKLAAYSMFLHPRMYWIPNSLPFLKLGTTTYDSHFTIGRMSAVAARTIELSFPQLLNLNERRKARFTKVKGLLGRETKFKLLDGCDGATWLRIPILADDAESRDAMLSRLLKAGFGATGFYPSALCDLPEIQSNREDSDRHCRNAESVARRIITLPNHNYVTDEDLLRMAEILNRGCED